MPQKVPKSEQTAEQSEALVGEDTGPDAIDLQSHDVEQSLVPIGTLGETPLDGARYSIEQRLHRAVGMMEGKRGACELGLGANRSAEIKVAELVDPRFERFAVALHLGA
jgi:hypothetical protein